MPLRLECGLVSDLNAFWPRESIDNAALRDKATCGLLHGQVKPLYELLEVDHTPMTVPACYLVGARPAKTIPTPDGGLDVLAFDWSMGDLQRDMSYLTRVTLPDVEAEVLSEEDFEARVAALRAQRRR